MSNVQTDNSFLDVKVKLRIDNLPSGACNVLDCYAGTGLIWRTIKKRIDGPGRRIKVLGMDRKKLQGIYLQGDNLKFLASMDISKFNVIDLDAYGVPYQQLKIIFSRKLQAETVVFVTFIQSVYGRLPYGMLEELGYSSSMIKKCPAPGPSDIGVRRGARPKVSPGPGPPAISPWASSCSGAGGPAGD